jgi:glycosyltransferase involved in cell wall biosynthesis
MGVKPPILLLAPIDPCMSGNGLAMRVASFAEAASTAWDVTVAVVPVAGRLPFCPLPVAVPVVTVASPEREVVARRFAAMLADPLWRELLADSQPMPSAARAASVARAGDVLSASGAGPGTPVLAIRSYLAPLAMAVAGHLASPWTALDLDDDDESLASAQGDDTTAAAYRRLVATFAPRFSAVSLASPFDALDVGRRHGLHTHVVPNAVAVPAEPSPRDPSSGVVLFVANLGYRPNAEAAVELVDRVLPALETRADRPVRIVLVGAYDHDGPIGALASHRAVTLAGFVDDVSDYYARAAVVVAPLSTGSGTRIKLIEAFARQVPVVTTPLGVAGLAVRHGEHVLIGETPEELAVAAADLLASPALAQSLTTAALQFVRRHHAAPVVAERVREFLATASSHGALS